MHLLLPCEEKAHGACPSTRDLGRVWVKSILTRSSLSHGFAVSFVSVCVAWDDISSARRTLGGVDCAVLYKSVSCIGGRSPDSYHSGKKPGLYSLASSFPMDSDSFICWLFTKYNGYNRKSNRSKNKMRAMAIYYLWLLIFISWGFRWLWKQLLLCTHWLHLVLSINCISVTWKFLPLTEFLCWLWLLSLCISIPPFSAQFLFCLELQRPQQLL